MEKSSLQIQHFTFGPFQENTYILFDQTKSCIIIDPGCYDDGERNQLVEFILKNNLNPVRLLNTHGHIDHIVGNKFISERFNLLPEINIDDLSLLESIMTVAAVYGFNAEPSPQPVSFLSERDSIIFGSTTLEVIHTSGHSPGSVCFIDHATETVVGGDVLFMNSIGRTDLPGGNHKQLIDSIQTKLLPLADSYKVYSGHGPVTTIGRERKMNPFL